MKSKRAVLLPLLVFLVAFSILLPARLAEATPVNNLIINGDFSDPTPLAGFTATADGLPATAPVIWEPTGEFAQLETVPNGPFIRTLEQTYTLPSVPTRFSFDFAFSTEGTIFSGGFPDSFAASKITTANGDFVDILVVDVFGALPDPSDGIESLTGAVPIDVAYDPGVTIPGFQEFAGGTTFSGHISLWLPNQVLGQEITLYFDLFDQNSVQTKTAIDNIVAQPIPEPGTIYLLLTGMVGLIWLIRRKAKKTQS